MAGALGVIAVVALVRTSVRRRRLRHAATAATPSGRMSLGAVRKTAPYALLFGASSCLLLLFGQVRLDRNDSAATVVLAIDVSDSMLATDVQPDRFTAAKAAASSFLDHVPPGFRISVVDLRGSGRHRRGSGQERAAVADAIEVSRRAAAR